MKGWAASAASAVRRAGRDVARLIVPVCCPGCGLDDVRWCEECESPWWEAPLRSDGNAARLQRGDRGLPVWSITDLEGSAQQMIEAWKDSDRRDLDAFFRDAMSRAALELADTVTTARRLAVVPIPARRASTRRRGVDLPGLLAEACAQRWTESGADAVVWPALTLRRAESRGLSARQRWRGVQHAMRVTDPPGPGRAVVLVDDVMTTGASLAAARDGLEGAGAIVCAGLTLASAPMRGTTSRVGLGWG